MATIKSEMPPLHAAAETTATSLSSLGSGGGVSSGSGGGGGGSGGTNTGSSTTNSSNATTNNATTSSASGGNVASAVNNTISAAADSSDNQPGTPQPQQTQQIGVNEQQQQQHQTSSTTAYGAHNMYATASTTTTSGGGAALPHMYGSSGSIYAASASGHDMQQQQQQQTYPSYLNSYEQFYQQQGQTQSGSGGGGGGGSNLDYGNAASLYGASNSSDYKASAASTGVRYHPYLQTPTSNGVGSGGSSANNDGHDASAATLSAGNNTSSGAVSTTTSMSPRIVSSSSPTSTSSQLHMGSSNTGGTGNPQSPACGQQLLCKKCGIMCTNESELQEHITNVHGASPYGSSGYSSSPYIKEELTGGPPTQPPQQQQTGGNPGELLDLDSQKMVYPPLPGSMQSIMGTGHVGLHQHHQQQQHHVMHDTIVSDPLHSMHTMQQRALPGWDQTPVIGGAQEGLPAYMQQTDISGGKPNQSPYYSPKQSPYGGGGGGVVGVTNIKQEYPLIKSEYADSQNYVDKSFDPTITTAPDMCQQQQQPTTNVQQSMLPVSSSPAEFPSTTTGSTQDQQQYRSFEPPTSSSVLPANSITAKAATWKSNEARRPKTYNCTACNKWFTSSGHLKRHYNTTLHKNAVKTSGQPDPATLPISAHHHPARDPSGKHSRRGGSNNSAAAAAAAAAAQQQKPPAPVQPPEPPRTPPDYATQTAVGGAGVGALSHYSTSPSPTSGGLPFGQQNGYQQTPQPYLSQVQSTTNASPQHIAAGVQQQQQQQQQNQTGTILNGHPNGLAGPSAHTTTTTTAATPTLLMPSSHTRGLLNTTTTTIIKREINAEEDININNSISNTNIHSPMDMAMMDKEMRTVAAAEAAETATLEQMQQQQQHHHQLLVKQELPDLAEQDYHHQHQQLLDLPQQQQHQHLQQQLRRYHNSTPSSRAQSPLIISHQQYQEQLHLQQQQQQMVADSIYTAQQQQVHMLPPLPLPLQANTMEAYNIIPLDISTQPQHSSNMQLLQPSQRITSTHMATTANMLDNIHMQEHSLLRHLQQAPEVVQSAAQQQQEQHNTRPHSNTTTITNMQQHTQQRINTTTITPQPPHMLTPLPQLQPSITNPIIPSFQQLLPPEVPPLQLEHTMTYHTIIGSGANGGSNNNNNQLGSHHNNSSNGNGSDCDGPTSSDLLQLSSYDPYGSSSMFTTSDGQILQFIPNSSGSLSLMHPTYFTTYPTRTAAVAESYVRAYSSSTTQRSPQEADLPPASTLTNGFAARSPQESQTTLSMTTEMMPYSPTVSSSTAADGGNNGMLDDYTATATKDVKAIKKETATVRGTKRASPLRNSNPAKRKRNSTTSDAGISTTTATVVLPSGRIKCVDCNKEFTKICYLTQHNKCFHSGEYPYRCEKCGKRFQSEIIYTTHLGRHKTADKPHKCQLCPKQFHHKTDLRRHIEAIHTGLKQHTCDVCEKSFCRKDHLRKHLETHSKLRVVSRKAASGKSATPRRGKATEKMTLDTKDFEKQAIPNSNLNETNRLGGADDDCGGAAALDVLVVIKNELNESQIDMHAALDALAADDDSLIDDDDNADDEVEMMMRNVTQMQQQQQQLKALHDQQQSMIAYVNGSGLGGGIPT